MLLFAADFAARAHTNQRRKNAAKTPYIEHPLGVALILSKDCEVTDTDILAAALLHDTIEDTPVTWHDLEGNFNGQIVAYVCEVTDDKSLPKAERKRLQIEHAARASPGAKLIKMADKLHNLTSFFESLPLGWSVERIQGYFVWSKAVTDACIANWDESHTHLRRAISVLQRHLDEVYRSTFVYRDIEYDCIPRDVHLDEVLEEYYETMTVAND